MAQYDSKTVNRTNAGFATPQEYREAAEGLRSHQERLYEAANLVFERTEAAKKKKAERETRRESMNYIIQQYSVIIRWGDSENSFIAQCKEIPGCTGMASNRDEAIEQVYDAIETNLRLSKEMNLVPPQPTKGQN
jgi:predicted RNase H-like HicB family nuclease